MIYIQNKEIRPSISFEIQFLLFLTHPIQDLGKTTLLASLDISHISLWLFSQTKEIHISMKTLRLAGILSTRTPLRSIGILFCILFITNSLQSAHAQHQQLGDVKFPTTCGEKAHNTFSSGLALYHHMMYEQAESTFSQATQEDPNCAIAYWGKAMTYFHPLWPGLPSEEQLKKGEEALNNAKNRSGQSSREVAFIEAASSFFTDWKTEDHAERIQRWENAQKRLLKRYPNDIEAGALYGLSHLATAPKSDKSFSHQKEAGAMMEALLKRAPSHPGLFHYIIHAYDNPVLASKAVDVARGYDKLAPEVPHALHMPTHIFVRLGLWPEVIQWNIRSADAALKQPVGDHTSMHYVHALDYLMYAYLQQGQTKQAKEVLARVNKVENYQAMSGSAYGIAAAQARFPLERRQWAEAASLPLRTHTAFPWGRFPEFEAITYFARGLGAAMLGDTKSARSALTSLNILYEMIKEADKKYWAVLVDSERKTIEAWIAFAEGNFEKASEMMLKSADVEDSVDKHPVTPGAVLPARELLGDMFLLLNQPEEALAAYEASLSISPNRFHSLSGASRAASLSGDYQKAASYAAQLTTLAMAQHSPITKAEHE